MKSWKTAAQRWWRRAVQAWKDRRTIAASIAAKLAKHFRPGEHPTRRVLFIGSPLRATGRFFDPFERPPGKWEHRHVDWRHDYDAPFYQGKAFGDVPKTLDELERVHAEMRWRPSEHLLRTVRMALDLADVRADHREGLREVIEACVGKLPEYTEDEARTVATELAKRVDLEKTSVRRFVIAGLGNMLGQKAVELRESEAMARAVWHEKTRRRFACIELPAEEFGPELPVWALRAVFDAAPSDAVLAGVMSEWSSGSVRLRFRSESFAIVEENVAMSPVTATWDHVSCKVDVAWPMRTDRRE